MGLRVPPQDEGRIGGKVNARLSAPIVGRKNNPAHTALHVRNADLQFLGRQGLVINDFSIQLVTEVTLEVLGAATKNLRSHFNFGIDHQRIRAAISLDKRRDGVGRGCADDFSFSVDFVLADTNSLPTAGLKATPRMVLLIGDPLLGVSRLERKARKQADRQESGDRSWQHVRLRQV